MNILNYVETYLRPAESCVPLPRDTVLGQSFLESTGGKHAPGLNFFGMKCGKAWLAAKKPKQYLWTKEMVDGQLKPVKDWFRKYMTPEECFADYKHFIMDNPRYAEAVKNTDNEELYIELIAKTGYSSLPWFEYKKRVLNCVKQVKITIASLNLTSKIVELGKEVTSNGGCRTK